MTFLIGARLINKSPEAGWSGQRKEALMEIINLGEADGLPPVDWAAVVEKLESGSAPAPDAMNARTT